MFVYHILEMPVGISAYILPWVLGSICVGLASGYFLGRSRGKSPETEQAHRERQTTLKALVDLLASAERMTIDVECHNNEITDAARHVVGLRVSGEMALVKAALLGQVESLLASNARLQKDLTCSRYRMEEQAQEIDHVRREARTDALTGVANRRAFDEKLEMLLTDWKKEGQPFSLILIDLDYFKRINDSHGHQAGDVVLEKVGQWLRQWVREGDFTGRYGGDEFAASCPTPTWRWRGGGPADLHRHISGGLPHSPAPRADYRLLQHRRGQRAAAGHQRHDPAAGRQGPLSVETSRP